MDRHGMIAIPALHDAATDRPIRFTPVCRHTAIPVCLNPAYASYLPATAAALQPVLRQLAGLPGAPARVSQAAAVYHQGAGNDVGIGLAGPQLAGRPPVYRLLLPNQLPGPALTAGEWTSQLRIGAGRDIVASVIGAGPGASRAQDAVATAIMLAARISPATPDPGSPPPRSGAPAPALGLAAGSPGYAAALRFAALPPATRHAWLMAHLPALRAGQIKLGQLP
jgi:hypothetical protein